MKAHRIAHAITIAGLVAFVVWCIADVFFVTVPFWVDEWRIIYNLKTRSIAGLWAPLDFMQQAPRAYLSLVKLMSSAGDYGYTALRIPALLLSCASVALAWRLMRRLFEGQNWRRYLFVLILVSSLPFTKYAVQVKHYPADILMALVALWQGLEMRAVLRGETFSGTRFALLVASFITAPFFSYTYPIALAPAFIALAIVWLKQPRQAATAARLMLMATSACTAIALAWWVDTRHAVADPQMRSYWRSHLWNTMPTSEKLNTAYTLFSQLGAGEIFSHVFGVLGLAAFVWHLTRAVGKRSATGEGGAKDLMAFMRLYSIGAIAAAWTLFVVGKLPLGEARLNTFLTLPIAWMLVDFLSQLAGAGVRKRWIGASAASLATLLYVGTAGNLLTTIAAEYTDALWPVKRRIYFTIGKAIQVARIHHLPILATSRIAFPEEAHDNLPFPEKMPGDWVLKTHPAYHFADSIPVYRLGTLDAAADVLQSLPAAHTAAVVCAGDTAFVIRQP